MRMAPGMVERLAPGGIHPTEGAETLRGRDSFTSRGKHRWAEAASLFHVPARSRPHLERSPGRRSRWERIPLRRGRPDGTGRARPTVLKLPSISRDVLLAATERGARA